MEDVSISKFRAQVVRSGSTPASPGFVVSEGQNPVDPSGSGQNHLPVTIATASTGLSITESQVLGGAGTVGQYIRGDGSLADFPATTGGGSSVSYYLNGSVSQGTIGGVAYREVNRTPIFGAGTDITTSSNGYIANFITDAGDPNKLLIPAGNWNLETYFSANSGGGSPTFYVELYKYNGTTFTLIATSSGTPELIAFGTNINPYFTTLAVPETVLALTDRLALRYYVNTSNRTITLHTEDNHLCQVITTFTTGLTALNGLTSQVQYLTVGTSGTDFAISSASDTHTFNLPTASATNRGALSSADWTTFNNKTSNLGTVTSVGLSSATSGVTIGSTPITTSGTITLAIATASGSQNGLLSSTDWTTFNGKQNALTNPVTGTGTTNYLPKFTGASTIADSNIFNSATSVGINTATPGSYGLAVDYSGPTLSVLSIKNTSSTGYSGAHFFNNSGSLMGHIGYANASTGAFTDSIFFGSIASKSILFTTADTTKMALFANGNLGLGVGTTDAGFKLDVNGTARFVNGVNMATTSGNVGIGTTSSTTYGTLVVVQNSVSSPDFVRGLQIVHPNGTGITGGYISMSNIGQKLGGIQVGDDLTAGNLVLNPVGGNVGIGTTTDNGARLQVSGTATISSNTTITGNLTLNGAVTRNINFFDSSNTNLNALIQYDQISSNSGQLFFGTNNAGTFSTKLTISNTGAATFTGSVTATTGTFSGSLLINEGNAFTDVNIKSDRASGNIGGINFVNSANTIKGQVYGDTDGVVYIASGGENVRLTISSVGRGLFGTPTASAGASGFDSKSFHVNAEIVSMGSSAGFFWENRSGGVTSNSNWYGWYTSAGTIFLYNGAANIASINTTTGIYTALSDRNKKKDFEKSTLGLNEILNLKPTLYRINTDSENVKKQLGFIAQEVKEYIPQAYVESEDFIGLNYNSIIPVLVNAIKELNDKIK